MITGGWDRVARLWDAATGRPVAPPLRHDGLLRAVAISPDGRTILTGSYDRTAQLWDKATGKPIGPAFRHESQVWFVGFSSDGGTAFSGGQENAAYLWEVPRSTEEPIDRIDLAVEVETGLTLGPTASLSKLDVSAWRILRDRLTAPPALRTARTIRRSPRTDPPRDLSSCRDRPAGKTPGSIRLRAPSGWLPFEIMPIRPR